VVAISLDKIKMKVIETSPNGVVNNDTLFIFSQYGNIVSAEYGGGKISKGFLVGKNENNKLSFSFCQLHSDGKLDTGISSCELSLTENGKIRLTEHFEWASRDGENGTNVFEEIQPVL